MLIAIALWSLAVAALWWVADILLDILAPGAAWLQANPELAAWIGPVLGVIGTLGASAAVIIWLVGVVLILVVGRLRPLRRVSERFGQRRWRDDGDRDDDRFAGWRAGGRDDDDDHDQWRDRRRRRRRDDDDDYDDD